jgi:cytoskeletal protein CcmA (bactofilin family)
MAPGAQQQTASHPRSRHLAVIALGIILVIATLALPLLAGASTYRAGLNVEINQVDSLSGNLYISASEIHFDASAPADVYIMAVTGDVEGSIDGSLNLLAGRTSVRADVGDSLLIAGGLVTIHGNVGGDLIVAGGNVTLSDQSFVDGDVIVTGGKIRTAGLVRGTVYGSALSIQHSGTVDGDMELQASRLLLDSSARVDGDIRYQSPIEADIAPLSEVTGTVERTDATPWNGIGGGALSPFGPLLKLTWLLLVGAVLVAAAPRLANRIAEHGNPFLQPAAVGLLSLFLVPVVAVLLLNTIIGIPIGVLLLMLLVIGVYMSQIFAGLTIGRILMPRSWRDGSRGFLLLAMTIGVLIIAILKMLPVPFLPLAVTAIVTFWGLGAVVLLVTDLTSSRLRERST